MAQMVKESACNAGDLGSIPGSCSIRKIPWSRVFFLGNPMDRGAWQAIVQGVTKGRTKRSDQRLPFQDCWDSLL